MQSKKAVEIKQSAANKNQNVIRLRYEIKGFDTVR